MSDSASSSAPIPIKKTRKLRKTPIENQTLSSPAVNDFQKGIELNRNSTAKSVLEFKFNKSRIKILSKTTEVKENCSGIVYWMSRDARIQDNWAFLFAQKLALKNHIPIHVCFCLVPKFLDATLRHFKFMLGGLQEVEQECEQLNIQFHLKYGSGGEEIPKFVNEFDIGAVVVDFSPLQVPKRWTDMVTSCLPVDVAFCQVDAHNIVPVWIASEKQEYAARTIRNKINSKLDIYLTEFPPIIPHPFVTEMEKNPIDWLQALSTLKCDRRIEEVDWAKPGYRAGIGELERFCQDRLHKFSDKRNDPLADALSNLSPWFHFGQISVQRSILTVKQYRSKYPKSVDAFCEEAIIRRELSDNFCYYNEKYDSLEGCADWARKTLHDHLLDKREYLYTKSELEHSKTHDDLWNSAQNQLRLEGKMHGFLRMYWAKKILEWTESPSEALSISIYLNDRYSLDGRDPNGYVGCLWSIGGLHDMGWKERSIFGKIRYMNYAGCKRKFDIKAYVARYDGK